MKIRKKIAEIVFAAVAMTAVLASCHKQEVFDNDPMGNFNALWTAIDENYCFFEYKNLDWNEIGDRYRARVLPNMTPRELFSLCSEMTNELKDGHTNLISSWDISYYRFWDQFPQNYDRRIVEQNYLNYKFKTSSGIQYMVMPNNFGYMHYGDFSVIIGEGNLDNILFELSGCDGLIIDVRDNGGGYLTNVDRIIGRFIDREIYAGAISHKTGPGHNDFSKPYGYSFQPAPAGRIKFVKPVVILTNRSSYSATNNFVSIMQYRENVRIVGDTTGGGSGMPFTSELPNGWLIRFSSCSITDPQGKITEFGVEPSPGCKVDMTPQDIAEGRDPILEKGFEVLQQMINSKQS